jgi:hypothetical protein
MAWAGRSLGEICRQIKDRAWAPGGKRTPAPDTQAAFGALMRAWFESGAVCPAE